MQASIKQNEDGSSKRYMKQNSQTYQFYLVHTIDEVAGYNSGDFI